MPGRRRLYSPLLLAAAAFALSACGHDGLQTDIKREQIDGVECVVVRNSTSGLVRAIDCDWEHAHE